MTTMQKFKAYFGMVPPGEYEDDYLEDASAPRSRPEAYARDGYDSDPYAAEPRERAGAYERAGYRDEYYGDYEDDYAPAGGYERASVGSYERAAAPEYTYAGPVRERYVPSRPEPRLEPLAPRGARPSARTSAPHGEELDHIFGEGNPLAKITKLRPSDYSEARTIGEQFRDGNPVIMDLVEMSNDDAKRLVDFAAGLAFALRGSFDKVATKVFLLSPAGIDVSADDRRKIAENGFYNHA